MGVNCMEDKICYVHMIECKNNAVYTGITNDVVRRWSKHDNDHGARYTKIHKCK